MAGSGIDLRRLPLIELRGGLTSDEFDNNSGQQDAAAIQLQNANLSHACLRRASLRGAHLEEANLEFTDLEGASLRGAHVGSTRLRFAFVDHTTSMRNVALAECSSIVDICWDAVDLANIDWGDTPLNKVQLGDEREARKGNTDYKTAIRANRQLAHALQKQGMNEVASHFAYQAQILQRKQFGLQAFWNTKKKWPNSWNWLFLWFLWLGGYGHRFSRLVLTYLIVLAFFGLFYCFYPPASINTHIPVWWGPWVTSLAAFHGRPFIQIGKNANLADYVTLGEALIGLTLEGLALAMLSQRFLCKS